MRTETALLYICGVFVNTSCNRENLNPLKQNEKIQIQKRWFFGGGGPKMNVYKYQQKPVF